MIFKVITLFPDFFTSPLKSSLLGRAHEKGILKTNVIDLRDYSKDRLKRCDDELYGGGSGMVMKVEPLFNCLDNVITSNTIVVNLSPSGIPLKQEDVKKISEFDEVCLICGHYEGIDQRVIDKYVDYEFSIGDYVLSGGEPAALVFIDSVARNFPGFMSSEDSLLEESFENNLLEYPHYTRPSEYEGLKVPDILLSGNHAEIAKWRLAKSIEKTKRNRPDMYNTYLEKKKQEN